MGLKKNHAHVGHERVHEVGQHQRLWQEHPQLPHRDKEHPDFSNDNIQEFSHGRWPHSVLFFIKS